MDSTDIKIKHPPLSIHLVLCPSPLTWLHTVTPDFLYRSRKLARGSTRKMVVVSWWKRSDFKTRHRTVGASMWFPHANKWAWLTWHLADGGAREASTGHQIPAPSKPSKTSCLSSWPSLDSSSVFIDHRFISASHYMLWVTVNPKSESSICAVVLPVFFFLLQLRDLLPPREYKTGRWLCFFTRACKEDRTARMNGSWKQLLIVCAPICASKKKRQREMDAQGNVCSAGCLFCRRESWGSAKMRDLWCELCSTF